MANTKKMAPSTKPEMKKATAPKSVAPSSAPKQKPEQAEKVLSNDSKNKVEKSNVTTTYADPSTDKKQSSNSPAQLSTSMVKFIESIKAIIFALLIGFLLIIITSSMTEGPRGDYGPLTFVSELFDRNFGSKMKITALISRLSYMIPLGLALAVSFRMGIFNIGASGQSFAGGVFAFWVASVLNIGKLGFIVTILVGVMVGMSIALLIAFLKNKFKINEVISSIMLNWIVFYIVLQVTPMIEASSPHIDNNDLRFDFITNLFALGGSTMSVSRSVNLGIIIMIPLAITVWWAYSKTQWGFKQDLIGNNKNSGKYLGISAESEMYKTMALSGALAGFAGVVYLVGYDNSLTGFGGTFTDIPGVTFDGITIALLGYNSPIGVIFSSLLFGLMQADGLDQQIGSYHIVGIILALMVLFIARSNLKVKYGGGK